MTKFVHCAEALKCNCLCRTFSLTPFPPPPPSSKTSQVLLYFIFSFIVELLTSIGLWQACFPVLCLCKISNSEPGIFPIGLSKAVSLSALRKNLSSIQNFLFYSIAFNARQCHFRCSLFSAFRY